MSTSSTSKQLSACRCVACQNHKQRCLQQNHPSPDARSGTTRDDSGRQRVWSGTVLCTAAAQTTLTRRLFLAEGARGAAAGNRFRKLIFWLKSWRSNHSFTPAYGGAQPQSCLPRSARRVHREGLKSSLLLPHYLSNRHYTTSARLRSISNKAIFRSTLG